MASDSERPEPEPDRRGFWARNRTTVHSLGYALAVIIAAPRWPYLLAGLPLVLIGVAIRTWSLGYLVKDAALCTAGPYAYVRNPLYLGSLFIFAGICVSANNFYLTVVSVLGTVLVYALTVRSEEGFLTARFGEAYRDYCARTPRLLPFRGRCAEPCDQRFSWELAKSNHAGELASWVAILFVVFLAKAFAGAHWHFWPYHDGPPLLTYGLWWKGF